VTACRSISPAGEAASRSPPPLTAATASGLLASWLASLIESLRLSDSASWGPCESESRPSRGRVCHQVLIFI
jgi:hypothetical protein